MSRLRVGRHPTDVRFKLWDAEPWLDPNTGEEVDWALYFLPGAEGSDWCNYRLVAEDTAEQKANYRFGYNALEARTCINSDVAALKEHRPGLYRKVMADIEARGLHFLTEDELKEIF